MLEKAQEVLAKFNQQGDHDMSTRDWQHIIRWVLPESKVPGLLKNLKTADAVKEFLNNLENPWASYIQPCVAAQDGDNINHESDNNEETKVAAMV